MPALRRLRALLTITVKRLLAQPLLMLATLLGLVTAVALFMTVPLYADAVYYRILQTELTQDANRTNRPPFTYIFRYVGAWHGPIEWEAAQAVDQYLSQSAGLALGLPQKEMVRHFETDTFAVLPTVNSRYSEVDRPLALMRFAFTDGIEAEIDVIEGAFPDPVSPPTPEAVEVLITTGLAQELGLQVGEEYTAVNRQQSETANVEQFTIRIAGVWEPKEPSSDFWFYTPEAYDRLLLVNEGTYVHQLSPALSDELYLGLWYFVLDGSEIRVDDVNELIGRATHVQNRTAALLPDIAAQNSPVEALEIYRQSAGRLTVLLFAYSVPVLGLVLAFIGLVVGLAVNERRNEIAVLRSRGATPLQIVAISLLEALLLGLLALVLGRGLAHLLAEQMGRARSFLDFSTNSHLRVLMTDRAHQAGLAAVGLALLAQLWPTLGAARHTIVTYKQERARQLRPPWWQRTWLDVLLFLPAAYGFYLLRDGGGRALFPAGSGVSTDPLQNPLPFFIPALAIFSATLLFLRLVPLVMKGVSWLLAQTDSIGLLLASRQLARTPHFYATPLILLILTVSLSVFTASLARTMDWHLYDQTYYQVGSEMDFYTLTRPIESGDVADEPSPYHFLPPAEFETIPGVHAAARVGRYTASARVGQQQMGQFIGIDRVDFGQVTYWRWDFSPYRLGSLLNALAMNRNGVLVSRSFLAQNSLNPGDAFRLRVRLYGNEVEMEVRVVGLFDYFPTWYESEDGPLFVGNLDHLFEQVGGEFPTHLWLRTEPELDLEQFEAALRQRHVQAWRWNEPFSLIEAEQTRPERQGLFGLLSVGFIATSILIVFGFFLYALFSFRRLYIELGMLRAVGLSAQQMIYLLAGELAFLILSGLLLGTMLGVWISRLFIPYLQITTPEAAGQIPPFLVEIAWPAISQIYLLFGFLFLGALVVLTILLLRLKLFQAIKLGETT